jgi:hypothetical protein
VEEEDHPPPRVCHDSVGYGHMATETDFDGGHCSDRAISLHVDNREAKEIVLADSHPDPVGIPVRVVIDLDHIYLREIHAHDAQAIESDGGCYRVRVHQTYSEVLKSRDLVDVNVSSIKIDGD